MPTFTMSGFKLQQGLCKDDGYIKSLIRKFWWGYKDDGALKNSLGWVEQAVSSKMPRRFGFLEMLNTSILLSWVSRYGSFYTIQIHSSYKVFKAQVFRNCSIMDRNVKSNGSYAWQSILKARSIISLGSTWRIGNRKEKY